MMSDTPDEPLDEQPPTYTYPFGPLFHGLFDRLWRAVANLQRREADTFDNILVKNALEIRGDQDATLILSPAAQDGAYSALTISRQMSGSLDIALTEYSADHKHATGTILLQVNLGSRTAHLGPFVVSLDKGNTPTISGVLDDPNSPPASAAAVQQILAALAANGLLKDATTMAPAEGAA